MKLPGLFHSLRLRLVILLLVAILPAFLLLANTYSQLRTVSRQRAQDEALRILRLSASQEEKLIEGAKQLLTVLSQTEAVQARDFAGCSKLASSLLSQFRFYSAIGVIDRSGKIVCSGQAFDPAINVADREYFQQVLKTREFFVGRYQIGRVSQKPSINVGYPLLGENQQVELVLVAGIDLAWLGNLANEIQLSEGSVLTMVDGDGQILYRSPDGDKWLGKKVPESNIFKIMTANLGEGTVESTGLEGKQKLFAYLTLEGSKRSGPVFLYLGLPEEVAYAAPNRILQSNLWGFLAISALAFGTIWFGGYLFILGNIRKLVSAVGRVAAGDYDLMLDNDVVRGEIGQLSSAVNQMTKKLKQREDEKQKTEEILRSQLMVQKEAEQNERQFISVASHQLLTPLALIKGYLAIVTSQRRGKVDKSTLKYLQEAKNGVDRMSRLVKDVLTISRAESKAIRIRQNDFNLIELVADCLRDFEAEAKRKGLELVYQKEGQIMVVADYDLVREVLVNLVDNALKFTDLGMVSVFLRREGKDFAKVIVDDTGVGIDENDREKIFEKFNYSQNWINKERESTGLGLYIARSLVEKMGGRMELENKTGKGARFTFTLPLVKEKDG